MIKRSPPSLSRLASLAVGALVAASTMGTVSAQFDAYNWTFLDKSFTGGQSSVNGDHMSMTVNPGCAFSDFFEYGMASMVVPQTGRFTFDYSAYSQACPSWGACLDTHICVMVGPDTCKLFPFWGGAPPGCEYEEVFFNDGNPYFVGASHTMAGKISVDAKKGDTLRLAVVTDGFSLDCKSIIDFVRLEFVPSLEASATGVSLSAGGDVDLNVSVPLKFANEWYWMIGSATGTVPGIVAQQMTIPLNYDAYTQYTLLNPNTFPLFDGLGILNAEGKARARFSIPAGLSPGLVGLQVHHAALILRSLAGLKLDFVTDPVSVTLLP